MSAKFTPFLLYCESIALSQNYFSIYWNVCFNIGEARTNSDGELNQSLKAEAQMELQTDLLESNEPSLVESRLFSHCDVWGKNTK